MKKQHRATTNDFKRERWLRIADLPFSRDCWYAHFQDKVSAVTVKKPGSRQGLVLIDGDSLDRYLESLAAEQAKEAK